MVLLTLGAIGIGSVWGSLLAGFFDRVSISLRNLLALMLATTCISRLVWMRSGAGYTAFLICATAAAWLAHAGLKNEIRKRTLGMGKSFRRYV
jgi:predicted MFS family arabinose efflux permease